MPTCPGCQRRVSYDQLDSHERYCHRIWSNEPETHAIMRLERKLADLETRLDERLRDLETKVERRTRYLERTERG